MVRAEKQLQQAYLSRAVQVKSLTVMDLPAVCPLHGDTVIQDVLTDPGVLLACGCRFGHYHEDGMESAEWRLNNP